MPRTYTKGATLSRSRALRSHHQSLTRSLRSLRQRHPLVVREELVHQLAQLGLELRLGADLELTRALAGEPEVLAQLLQRHRLVVHDPLLDDVSLARVEPAERFQ